MAIVNYGDISPRTALRAAKKLLRVGLPLLVTQRFGQPDNQPMGATKTRKWRRYTAFPVSSAPLAEGITPSGHAITYEDVEVVLEQYGDLVKITDVIQDTHEDPVLKVNMERSGEQAAQTIETVTVDVLKGGTNVYYANSVANRALVTAPVSTADLRLVVRGFDRALATPISEVIAPSAKVSTMGVERAFYAMAHTDLEPDIRNLTGFKTIVEYGSPGKHIMGEVGAVERVRFILTTMFTPWLLAGFTGSTYLANGAIPGSAAKADVYPIIIVARDAYGVVRLQGMNAVKVMVLNPGVPRAGDELGQRGSVSWKTWYAAVILNDYWMARLEVACTAKPSTT